MYSNDQLAKWVHNPTIALQHLRNKYPLGRRLGLELSSRGLLGTHVLSKDWDVLLVLDTCRVDALRMVADEYNYLGDVERMWSVGGSSPEWMAATFDQNWASELRETAYLSANGYADFIFEAEGDGEEFIGPEPNTYFYTGNWNFAKKADLGRVEHVWKHERRGEEGPLGHTEGPTPPRYLTERAIAVGRESEFERLILHYHQPHRPYMANALKENRPLYDYERDPWEYMRTGGAREIAFGAYLDELRYVLDDIKLLLDNIDANTVAISADHGDAFGEFGGYGHSSGSIHPHVRTVPWTTTSAVDTGNYETSIETVSETDSKRDVDELLQNLGYKG